MGVVAVIEFGEGGAACIGVIVAEFTHKVGGADPLETIGIVATGGGDHEARARFAVGGALAAIIGRANSDGVDGIGVGVVVGVVLPFAAA